MGFSWHGKQSIRNLFIRTEPKLT